MPITFYHMDDLVPHRLSFPCHASEVNAAGQMTSLFLHSVVHLRKPFHLATYEVVESDRDEHRICWTARLAPASETDGVYDHNRMLIVLSCRQHGEGVKENEDDESSFRDHRLPYLHPRPCLYPFCFALKELETSRDAEEVTLKGLHRVCCSCGSWVKIWTRLLPYDARTLLQGVWAVS
jgi:hypothetical protein